MAGSFKDLADRAQKSWSPDTVALYEAAKVSFQEELDAQKNLGAMLAVARKQRHLTQPQLAELTGVQQAEISRIENGRGNPTVDTLNKLAAPMGWKLTLVAA